MTDKYLDWQFEVMTYTGNSCGRFPTLADAKKACVGMATNCLDTYYDVWEHVGAELPLIRYTCKMVLHEREVKT